MTVEQVLSEPAGRRLDSWILEVVYGWPVRWVKTTFAPDAEPEPQDPSGEPAPRFSSSWAAAGPLLGRGFGVEACRTARDDKGWLAWQFGSPRECVEGDSGPHAIARAVVVATLEGRDGR